jgi:hypothetical protein
LDCFAVAEQDFLSQEFLAPAVRGGEVRVRMAGVVLQMRFEPDEFEGWGVFRPVSHRVARLVREARLGECRRYVQLMTNASLVLCNRSDCAWSAVPAHRADRRFKIEGTVPVRLVDGADLFDTVRAGFDGANFWYDRVDPRGDAAVSAWLRSAIAKMVEPTTLNRKGLTAEQRAAYAVNYFSRLETRKKTRRDTIEAQLRESLRHAGADFVGYAEHKDGYRVTYHVGGQRQVSSVNKHDLTVQVAGICLSGQDQKFDLTSLVGVLNEARGHVVAVGPENSGMQEDEYWRAHPPNR